MKPKPTPGRPRLDPAGSVNVSVRVAVPAYDRMHARAAASRLTLAAWMRRTLDPAEAAGRRRP